MKIKWCRWLRYGLTCIKHTHARKQLNILYTEFNCTHLSLGFSLEWFFCLFVYISLSLKFSLAIIFNVNYSFICQPPIPFDFQHVCVCTIVRSFHTNFCLFYFLSICAQNKYSVILRALPFLSQYSHTLFILFSASIHLLLYFILNCKTPARIQFSVGAQINNIIAARGLHSLSSLSLSAN